MKGQALVSLLFFIGIAVIVTSAAVVIIVTNNLAASKFELGNLAFGVAESGAENALLKLLRDPNYTGETLAVGGGDAIITVGGGAQKVITIQGTVNDFVRTIEVRVSYTDNVLSVTSWKEIF